MGHMFAKPMANHYIATDLFSIMEKNKSTPGEDGYGQEMANAV